MPHFVDDVQAAEQLAGAVQPYRLPHVRPPASEVTEQSYIQLITVLPRQLLDGLRPPVGVALRLDGEVVLDFRLVSPAPVDFTLTYQRPPSPCAWTVTVPGLPLWFSGALYRKLVRSSSRRSSSASEIVSAGGAALFTLAASFA